MKVDIYTAATLLHLGIGRPQYLNEFFLAGLLLAIIIACQPLVECVYLNRACHTSVHVYVFVYICVCVYKLAMG